MCMQLPSWQSLALPQDILLEPIPGNHSLTLWIVGKKPGNSNIGNGLVRWPRLLSFIRMDGALPPPPRFGCDDRFGVSSPDSLDAWGKEAKHHPGRCLM